jgi:fumarate reductase iron-sulfur subunit
MVDVRAKALKEEANTRNIEIRILRYRPEQDQEPVWQSYTIPFTDDMSVLQGLQYIKDELDSTLSYRWSCRMAICGSCGMMIDGKPNLACHTFLREFYPQGLRVEPLNHFPIERDLVIRPDAFIEKLESIKPYIVPREAKKPEDGEFLQTPAQLEKYEQFSNCINCMLCYAACPQFGLNSDFIGPGVMALLHRYNEDSRDCAKAERMELVNAEEGVWNCTAVAYCSEVCPKGVDPASAVNLNKINSATDYFFNMFGIKKKEGATK